MPPTTSGSYSPKGDQPTAINSWWRGNSGERYQTLLGATGTGKTFTMANVIAQTGRRWCWPTTRRWRRSCCNELREFFPENAVEYFIYYDYYQPERSVSDALHRQTASINEEIDMLRLGDPFLV